jgi:ribonuclease P protein component
MTVTLVRLKRRADFVALAEEKRRFALKDMVIQYRKCPDHLPNNTARIGFTVTKKQGNAVVRNRIRRRLKAATAELLPDLAQASYDYVFIARSNYAHCTFDKIMDDLRFAFGHMHHRKTTKVPQ